MDHSGTPYEKQGDVFRRCQPIQVVDFLDQLDNNSKRMFFGVKRLVNGCCDSQHFYVFGDGGTGGFKGPLSSSSYLGTAWQSAIYIRGNHWTILNKKNSTEMLAVILGAIECQGPNLFLSFITVISFWLCDTCTWMTYTIENCHWTSNNT